MSGAGIYTAETYCAEELCTSVDRFWKLGKKKILESV
jgi:hypothetical protein